MLPISHGFLLLQQRQTQRVLALLSEPRRRPTESLLGLDAWNDIAEENPVLAGLEPDVEAFLGEPPRERPRIFLSP